MTGVGAAAGVDLGTGSVKVAVVSTDGEIQAKASRPYGLSAPQPGWAEADPGEWLAATSQAAEELGAALGATSAVGFSGQMHGVVLCDEKLEPVRPAITWADTRSAQQAADMHETLGEQTLARLGSPAVSGFAATSLAWLARHEPDSLSRARYVLQPKDWLRARLGGAIVTEPSDASGTLLANVATGTWDDDAIAWCGVDRDSLPPIVSSDSDTGAVFLAGRELASVVGAADTAAAIAGFGLQVGDGFVAVGSGSQTVSVVSDPNSGIERGTHLFATAGAPGSGWYRIGAVQNAGIALRRALEWLQASPDEANAALEGGVRSSDPIFVPYIAGERTPFVDAALRGAWLGLGLNVDRKAMLRSVVEGVANAVALGMQAVAAAGATLPDPLPMVGGGTADPRFRQLIADASGRCLRPTDEPDAAVIGAARLAAGGTMSVPPLTAGTVVVEPDASKAELLHERQRQMIDYVHDQIER